MDSLTDKLFELTYSGATRKQKSITSLFPPFVSRVKAVAAKGGVKLQNIKMDTWHFKVHSGTKNSVWYDDYIKFIDLPELLSSLASDRRLWTKDKQHINLTKLAREVMTKADIQWLCNCPADLYYGGHYIRTQRNAKVLPPPENRPPKKRNPKQYGIACKHLQAVFNVFPWYVSDAAKWLRDFYGKQLQQIENQAKKEQTKFKSAADALAKKKEKQNPKKIVKKKARESISERSKLGSCMLWAENKTKELLEKGINDFKVVEGWVYFKGFDPNEIYTSHTWIELKSGEVLDGTIDQFEHWGFSKDKIIYGDKKFRRRKEYTPEQYLELCKKYPIEKAENESINMKKANEDLQTLSDPKLKKMFAQDKVEDLERRIKDLEQIAKSLPKGFMQSNVFAKIDKHQNELAQLKRGLGEKVKVEDGKKGTHSEP